MAHRIIDADGHICETKDLWDDYVPRAYRDRTIRMDKDDKGRPIFKFTMPSRPLVEHSALCDVSDALRQGLVAVTGCRVGQGRAKTQIVPRLG